jgi:hypothetical protein
MSHSIDDLPDTPFNRQDALGWGIRPRELRTARERGLVVALFRGAYVRSDIELTPMVRARAVALVVGKGSVIRDRTAAWVWGVDVFEYAEHDGLPHVEVCELRGANAARRLGVAGATRDLVPADWVEIGGVRVTTPRRTALDLGCFLRRRSALAAMDALAKAGNFTAADLQRELHRYFRRRGVVQLRELVPLVDPRAESMAESWVRLVILDAGLPTPVANFWVVVDGVQLFRLDLAYPRARVCVEYDGEEFHSSDEQKADDEERRAWLRAHGWIVIVLTKESFTDEAIWQWIAELRAALRGRTQPPPPAYRGASRRRQV